MLHSDISPLARRAVEFYESELRSKLEPDHNGEGIAIHPDSGDYEIAKSPTEAGIMLRTRRKSGTVTMRIGPPTSGDVALAERIRSSKSH